MGGRHGCYGQTSLRPERRRRQRRPYDGGRALACRLAPSSGPVDAWASRSPEALQSRRASRPIEASVGRSGVASRPRYRRPCIAQPPRPVDCQVSHHPDTNAQTVVLLSCDLHHWPDRHQSKWERLPRPGSTAVPCSSIPAAQSSPRRLRQRRSVQSRQVETKDRPILCER